MRWVVIILILTLGGVLTLIFISKEKDIPSPPLKENPEPTQPPAITQTTQNKEEELQNEPDITPAKSYDFLNPVKLGESCLKLYKKGKFQELSENIENNKCEETLSENEKLLIKASIFSAISDKVKETEILEALLTKTETDEFIKNNIEKIFCRFIEIAEDDKKYQQVKDFIYSRFSASCLDKKILLEAGDYFYNQNFPEEARRLYSKAYFLLNKEEQKEYYKKLVELNDKIIFSAKLYSDSFTYTVVKGDILIKIGKKFSITPELIKKINKLFNY